MLVTTNGGLVTVFMVVFVDGLSVGTNASNRSIMILLQYHWMRSLSIAWSAVVVSMDLRNIERGYCRNYSMLIFLGL